MEKNKSRHKFKICQPAFSLVEVIISVALFVVIMLSSTQIFKLVIDGQRSAIASQNVQESLKYFLEVTAKEVRMAKKNTGACPGFSGIFAVSSNELGDKLSFQNYNGQCVSYYLEEENGNRRFAIKRDNEEGFISPSQIRIDNLRFILSAASGTQPAVTINLRAWALNGPASSSEMTIQTTLTSRYYK